MELRIGEILRRFKLISGFDRKDTADWVPIIYDTKLYFEERIGELSPYDTRRMEQACAVYAFRRISRFVCQSDLSSFKVGDVQMSVKELGDTAQKLWEEERECIADLVDMDPRFGFRSVTV